MTCEGSCGLTSTVVKLSHKRFGIKSMGDTGEISADIATLNVKDKDDDVTLPGFFGKQDVKIVLSHQWGSVMLGKGQISEQGDKAVLDGKMNLDEADAEARAVHSRLKFDLDNPPPLIEWSYAFDLKKGAREQFTDDEKFGDGFWLQPVDGKPGAKVLEASPVLVGAGEGTGTTAVKSAGQTLSILDALAELGDDEAKQLLELHNLLDLKQEDQKFIDQLDRTLAAVLAVQKRAEEITEERPLGRDSAERTREIAEALLEAEQKLRGVTVDDANLGLGLPTEDELALMLAQTQARLSGRAYARTN